MRRKRKKKKGLRLIQLYKEVSDKAGVHMNTTREVLDALWPLIRAAITDGCEIKIPYFGAFHQRTRVARKFNDVNNVGHWAYAPESTLIHFEPDKDWILEHYLANAVLPNDPSELPDGVTLSKRLIPALKAKGGTELVRKFFPDYEEKYKIPQIDKLESNGIYRQNY